MAFFLITVTNASVAIMIPFIDNLYLPKSFLKTVAYNEYVKSYQVTTAVHTCIITVINNLLYVENLAKHKQQRRLITYYKVY